MKRLFRSLVTPRSRALAIAAGLLLPLMVFQNCSDQRFANVTLDSNSLGVISGSFKINNGAAYTNSVGVSVQIQATNAYELIVQNDSCPDENGVYQPLQNEMSWVLTDRDGTVPVYMRFRDQEGQVTPCVEASIILDREAPTLAFLSGAEKVSSKVNAAFALEAKDSVSGIDKIYCRAPGAAAFAECKSSFNLNGLLEGANAVVAYAEDKAGNKSEPQEYSFLIDLTPPTVVLKDPLPPDVSTINSVIVNFEGADNVGGSGLDRFLCTINNTEIPNCSSPVVLNNLQSGNYTFAVRAIDKVGHMSLPAMRAFTVDLNPSGAFQILGVTGGNDVKVDAYLSELVNPKLHWSVSDGAQSYNVSIYDAANVNMLCGTNNINGLAIEQVLAGCGLVDNGSYVARATAFRNNIPTNAPNFAFKVDASGPVITINPVVKDDEKKTANFTFSIVDSGSGVKAATCYKKYKTDIRMDDCSGKTSMAYTNLPEGEHEFYIVASDQLDHVSTSATVKFNMQYVVCDPFNLVEGKCVKGLKGNLYYASASDRATGNDALRLKFSTVDKMITLGLKSNAVIYLPYIDVRTRNFTDGFGTEGGGKLKDDAGKVLDEWFALDLESVIKLGDTDQEGWYQFITVSDDGSNMYIKESVNGPYRKLIDNDGIHSTRVGCAASGDAIQISRTSRIPVRFDYIQGPRTEIAMSVFWRRVDSKNAARSTHCGRTDNNQNGVNAILAEGFKPLGAMNFILAEEAK